MITVARIVKGNEFKSDNDTETIAFYIQVLRFLLMNYQCIK